MTVGFHFIFPPISIGLAWLLVIVETLAWRRQDETYARMGKFFAKFLGITFVLGVATGITMEFQFGTNWAQYARFVGDIFGGMLAAEAILSFFLESTFLGLYLFGRGRVSNGVHWFSSLMVAVGATLSAFWILVANSWQQTPAGFMFNPQTGRAELASFRQAVFNPSMVIRFFHTMDAALITGAFFMAGIAAYLLIKDNENAVARRALKLAVIFGFVVSILELFPFGHEHARQVGRQQPLKLATYEGLFETGARAPLTLIGLPAKDHLAGAIRIPGLLSLLVGFRLDTVVHGIKEFPEDERPPLFLPFLGFHGMVGLGLLFIVLMGWGVFQLWRGRLWTNPWYLAGLIVAIPLPVIACQLGWVATEVGRQPWIVYGLLRTRDAVSMSVSAGEVLFSTILFGAVYALLLLLYVFLVAREARRGPEPARPREVRP
jgi:cytochrome d ubiquinol oxidase subunit I